MRILLVHPGPEFSVADVFEGWRDALTGLGHQVGVYNTNDRLQWYARAHFEDLKAEPKPCGCPVYKRGMTNEGAIMQSLAGLSHVCYTFWPDLVFFVSAFFFTAPYLELLKTRKHKVVMLHTESPYQDDEQLERAQFADLNLLNDPVNLARYEALGPAEYMPHAYDPKRHYPRKGDRDPEQSSDFAFVGTVYESRKNFFEAMRAAGGFDGHDVLMGGSGWEHPHMDGSPLLEYLGHPRDHCVPNDQTADVYRNTRVGINFYRREGEKAHHGEGWSIGPREVEMAACGLPFLRDPRGESDEVFGDFMPSFGTAKEAAEQLNWYLRHESARQKTGQQAREAIKDRTFSNHARRLMGSLDAYGILPPAKLGL